MEYGLLRGFGLSGILDLSRPFSLCGSLDFFGFFGYAGCMSIPGVASEPITLERTEGSRGDWQVQ